MRLLNAAGRDQVSEKVKSKLLKLFTGYCCDDRETQRVIRTMFERHGYLIDTHTAVAFSSLEQYRSETGDETPAIVASTASPFKFCTSVLEALGETSVASGLDALDQLTAKTGQPAPRPPGRAERQAGPIHPGGGEGQHGGRGAVPAGVSLCPCTPLETPTCLCPAASLWTCSAAAGQAMWIN